MINPKIHVFFKMLLLPQGGRYATINAFLVRA